MSVARLRVVTGIVPTKAAKAFGCGLMLVRRL